MAALRSVCKREAGASILAVSFMLLTNATAAAPLRPELMVPPPQDVMSACAASANEPRLSLHVEVRDELGLWRAGESVQVSSMDGFPLAAINCDGPWVNFVLPAGKYRVMAVLGPERSNEKVVDIPSSGTAVTLMLESAPTVPGDAETVG